jgi:hypothetical protein
MRKSPASTKELQKQLRQAQQRVLLLERLLETQDILIDADLVDKIRRSERDIKRGRYVSVQAARARLTNTTMLADRQWNC